MGATLVVAAVGVGLWAVGPGRGSSDVAVAVGERRGASDTPPSIGEFTVAPVSGTQRDVSTMDLGRVPVGREVATSFTRSQRGDLAFVAPVVLSDKGVDQAQDLRVVDARSGDVTSYRLPFARSSITRVDSFDTGDDGRVAAIVWSCPAADFGGYAACGDGDEGWIAVSKPGGDLEVIQSLGGLDPEVRRAVRFVGDELFVARLTDSSGTGRFDAGRLEILAPTSEKPLAPPLDGVSIRGIGELESQVCVLDGRITAVVGTPAGARVIDESKPGDLDPAAGAVFSTPGERLEGTHLVQLVDGAWAEVGGTRRERQDGLSYLLCHGSTAWLQRGGVGDSTLTRIVGGRGAEVKDVPTNATVSMALAAAWLDPADDSLLLGSVDPGVPPTGVPSRIVRVSTDGSVAAIDAHGLDVDLLRFSDVAPVGTSLWTVTATEGQLQLIRTNLGGDRR
jgi:hypothetical protein